MVTNVNRRLRPGCGLCVCIFAVEEESLLRCLCCLLYIGRQVWADCTDCGKNEWSWPELAALLFKASVCLLTNDLGEYRHLTVSDASRLSHCQSVRVVDRSDEVENTVDPCTDVVDLLLITMLISRRDEQREVSVWNADRTIIIIIRMATRVLKRHEREGMAALRYCNRESNPCRFLSTNKPGQPPIHPTLDRSIDRDIG